MLQLVVFWHEGVQLPRELLDRTCQLQFAHQTVSVLFQLLRLDLFISVQVVNPVVKMQDLLASLFILASLVTL